MTNTDRESQRCNEVQAGLATQGLPLREAQLDWFTICHSYRYTIPIDLGASVYQP